MKICMVDLTNLGVIYGHLFTLHLIPETDQTWNLFNEQTNFVDGL